MKVKRIFDTLRSDISAYQSEITLALSKYSDALETAKQTASKFKDESGELERRKAALISEARAAVQTADKRLCDNINLLHVPALKTALCEYMTAAPDRDFMAALRDYKDFDLTVTKEEVVALLPGTEGNYRAMKAIASVAAESGISVTTPKITAFLDDVKALEKLGQAPVQWCPIEYGGEAAEVFKDQLVRNPETGEVRYVWGPLDVTGVILARAALNAISQNLDDRAAAWENSFVPVISDFAPKTGENGETLTPEQQRSDAVQRSTEQVSINDNPAEELGRKIGQKKAAQAGAGLEEFTVK